MEKKVLTLSVSKQWFDMIADERKDEEYREIKPYWASRLVNQQAEGGEVLFDEYGGYCCVTGEPEYKPYTHVLFINGYRKDSPRIERRLRVSPSANLRKAYAPTSGLIPSFLSLNLSDMNYIQCDECKYRLVCNGEPLTSGSTGSCDHRVISNTPIFPKIKTPPDERYADIWNW